ncbi:HPP family protein [Alkalithermobacter paradoxus]|uniref:HPP family protein n=1 Tax=Alkalithermobacter paradoxus TaxID=29349 RepID=A0A1V4I792_9FIRM|nr:HPP family protein [[Clostridium] thermoalcaliphilum]
MDQKKFKSTFIDAALIFVGAFIAIGLIAYLGLGGYGLDMIAPPFGAAAVLLFAAPSAALAQPKNVFFGQLISALAGTSVYHLLGKTWYSIALAVALAIVLMLLTKTVHPPGGATAFLAVAAEKSFMFIINPVLIGTCILVIVAIIINYLQPQRSYIIKKNNQTSTS